MGPQLRQRGYVLVCEHVSGGVEGEELQEGHSYH